MKTKLERRRQAMLQLHLSDQQVYSILRYRLYQMFDGTRQECFIGTGVIVDLVQSKWFDIENM